MKNKLFSTYKSKIFTFVVSGILIILAYRFIFDPSSILDFIQQLTSILQPIIIGLTIAYLLCPMYNSIVKKVYALVRNKIENKNIALWIGRIIATAVSMTAFVAFVTGFFWIILPELLSSIIRISETVPANVEESIEWIEIQLRNSPEVMKFVTQITDDLYSQALTWFNSSIVANIETVFLSLSTGLIITFSTITDIILGIIVCIYFLNTKETFKAQGKIFILATFSEPNSNKIFEFMTYSNRTFGGFVNGKILDSIIIGILCYILSLTFRFPYPELISVVIGVTNVVPFFGPFFGAIPTAIIVLLVSPGDLIYFLLMVLGLQQFDGNILGPAILGERTGIASFWVIFAILLGGGLFGFFGMLLGVPVFAILYYYIGKYYEYRMSQKNLSPKINDYMDYSTYGVEKEELANKKK